MLNVQFSISLRSRLYLDLPMCNGVCKHKRPDGSICGKPLDVKGTHARSCAVGGWLVRKHNNCLGVLADWAEEEGDCTTFREQVLPTASPDHSQARIDLVVFSPRVAGPMFVDLTVVSALSVEALAKNSATQDGVAARLAAADKVNKYPQCRLMPFPLEDHGRLGDAAMNFAKLIAPVDPERRSVALSRLYHGLAAVLQRTAADAIITACA
jgi:hypothetical protein